MLKHISLSLVFFSVTFLSMAQSGDYYVTHWKQQEIFDPSQTYDLVQRGDGLMVGANKDGILLFDGAQWELYGSPGSILSLAVDESGVYAAGTSGLTFHPNYNPGKYELITRDSAYLNAKKVIAWGDRIFLLNNQSVSIYSKEEHKHLNTIKQDREYFRDLFIIGQKVAVVTDNSIYYINDGRLTFAEDLPRTDIVAVCRKEEDIYLIYQNADIYKKNNTHWEKLRYDRNNYENFFQGIEATMAIISNDLLAISSINSGIFILNLKTKKLEKVVGQNNGLADNTVNFLSGDIEGGIWVGHSNGISRVAPYIPLRDFSHYPGLEGEILTVHTLNKEVFVGTSNGLYQLKKVINYDEVFKYIKIDVSQVDKKEDRKPGKGIFSIFKRNKEDTKEQTEDEIQKVVTRELSSIRWLYRKVEEIEGKVNQIRQLGNALVIASADGLFIKDKDIKKISAGAVRFVWVNKNNTVILANTYSGELLSFQKKGQEWVSRDYFLGFDADIFDVIEDSKNRLWIVTATEIFYVTYDQNDVYLGKEFAYHNPFMDRVIINEKEDGRIEFISGASSWYFDELSHALKPLEKAETFAKILKSDEHTWILKQDSGWYGLNHRIYNRWINAFEDANLLAYNSTKDSLFIISKNALYKVPAVDNEEISVPYNLILKTVQLDDNLSEYRNNFRITERQESLVLTYVLPEYTNLFSPKYSYSISNLSDQWSAYKEGNKKIRLNYLPEGRYSLRVRTQLGAEEKFAAAPFNVIVVAPYWKRPLFYAFEFTLLGVLLLFTIYLNHNSKKYRLLNRMLAFLVLIMIIEFIQVLAESYFQTDISPFVGFFVQVFVAFLVLPVEGFLRGIITQDKKLKLPLFPRINKK